MAKSRRNRVQSSTRGSEGQLNFRLCHICLHLNESHKEIANCKHCHAPFQVANADFGPSIFGADDAELLQVPPELREDLEVTGELQIGKALNGLTVRW